MVQQLLKTCAVALLGALISTAALAAKPEVFSRNGAAINGYDPVAYFTEEKPVKGSRDHSLNWKDAVWLFSSADNKALFEADPDAYAPQYGGITCCLCAVSQELTANDRAGRSWTVYDGQFSHTTQACSRAIGKARYSRQCREKAT